MTKQARVKWGGNGEKEPKPFQNSTDIFQLSTKWMKEQSQKIAGSLMTDCNMLQIMSAQLKLFGKNMFKEISSLKRKAVKFKTEGTEL